MIKHALKHFPELEGEELHYIARAIQDLNEEELDLFKTIYRARRKDPVIFMLLALLGMVGAAGIHRLFVGQVGLGILYFFTAGFCFIGTIVDAINYRSFSFEYNRNIAQNTLKEIK
ncbi:MAG: TM2 domain-containing protein [Bacteroidota bacterium]